MMLFVKFKMSDLLMFLWYCVYVDYIGFWNIVLFGMFVGLSFIKVFII